MTIGDLPDAIIFCWADYDSQGIQAVGADNYTRCIGDNSHLSSMMLHGAYDGRLTTQFKICEMAANQGNQTACLAPQ